MTETTTTTTTTTVKDPRRAGLYDHQCPLCLRPIRWALTYCALCPRPRTTRNGAWDGTAAL